MRHLLALVTLLFFSTAFADENCYIKEFRLIEEGGYNTSTEKYINVNNLNDCIAKAKTLLGREDIEKVSYSLERGSAKIIRDKRFIHDAHIRTYKVKLNYMGEDTNGEEVVVKFKTKDGFFETLREIL